MVRRVEPLLGTRAEVAVTAVDDVPAASFEHAILEEVARLEHIFSVHDEASALIALRRTGATDVPELQAVLDLALRWHESTGGAFHPGMQALVDLWNLAERNGRPPTREALAATVAAIENVGVEALDLNAIAKGWIAERAVAAVMRTAAEVTGAWLSLGGDVVHRGAGSVRVGIEDPRRPYDNVAPLASVELCGEALATSGGARRWWSIGGRRYSKVIDPRTGEPVDRCASATVVAADAATADVLATVANVASTEETLALVHDAPAACFLVHHDGSTTSSSRRFRPSQTR